MDALGSFGPNPILAVAVSGGADSMALTLLLNRWTQRYHGKLYAMTVDHGLREESFSEAKIVQGWMKDLNISHEILQWQGEKPQTHIQDRARRARYALLENYCREREIIHLFLAHHLEDQAETFWLRFLKKSGIDGLAAMPFIQETPFLRKIRPCLHISKARLHSTLEVFGHPYLKDPSNNNMDFQRVKIRAQQDMFKDVGLTPHLIKDLVQKNTWVKEALEQATFKALFEGTELSPLGYLILQMEPLKQDAFEISRRVLEKALMCIGGGDYPPRWESLIPILECLRSKNAEFFKKTLNHTLLKKKGGVLYIMPETKKSSPLDVNILDLFSKKETSFVWDGRFLIKLSEGNLKKNRQDTGKRLVLKPLGGRGRAILKKQKVKCVPHPWEVLESLPSLWEEECLLSVPHLKWGMESWLTAGFEKELFFYPKVFLSP